MSQRCFLISWIFKSGKNFCYLYNTAYIPVLINPVSQKFSSVSLQQHSQMNAIHYCPCRSITYQRTEPVSCPPRRLVGVAHAVVLLHCCQGHLGLSIQTVRISPSLVCGYICKQIQVSLKKDWEIAYSNAVVFPPREPTFLLGCWIPMWNLTHSQIMSKILWFLLLEQFLCLVLICFHGINWGLSLVAAQIPCS